MNKYLAELIGTFFLVLTIGCTVIGHGAGPLAPLAIGSALMVMTFAGGHISGGHFNPAVTLGVWLGGKCEAKDVAPYMIFQIMGAVLAAVAVKFLKGGGRCCAAPTGDRASACGRVSFHVCARVRRSERCHGQGYSGQFFLWAGDRIHGAGGGVFRRQHFRWSVQPSGRGGHLRYGAVFLAEYLDLPGS
jgi:hypothetical protein